MVGLLAEHSWLLLFQVVWMLYVTHSDYDTPPIAHLPLVPSFLDTLHEACLTHSVYWYLVESWGVPEGLGFAVW